MENLSDWILKTIREDEKKGIMSGWLEEKRFVLLPIMARSIQHLISGRSIIILTDNQFEWFGNYILTHINRPHAGRPFFPIVKMDYLDKMIDLGAKENGVQGFKLIYNMLDMMYGHYIFWYVGKKNARADFAMGKGDGLYWILDEVVDDAFGLSSTDEKLDYKLLGLLKLFDRAILEAMLNRISLEI